MSIEEPVRYAEPEEEKKKKLDKDKGRQTQEEK
jgi:hypothetical protein